MYSTWPVGKLPLEFQRPELNIIQDLGYSWKDPRDIIEIFENKIAKFTGAKYAVTVDCCSHGIFLALKYFKATGNIIIPAHTYPSVPMQIIHVGANPEFEYQEWEGVYRLKPYPIFDGAVRWTKDMCAGQVGLFVTSFQIKKRVPIGRGGAIITNDADAYNWLIKARYDGRDLNKYDQWEDPLSMVGWHFYMTPEDAARGIILMDNIPEYNPDSGSWRSYADMRNKKVWQQH